MLCPNNKQVSSGHTQWEDPSQPVAATESEEKAGGIENSKAMSPKMVPRSPPPRSPAGQRSPPPTQVTSPANHQPPSVDPAVVNDGRLTPPGERLPEYAGQGGSLIAKLKATATAMLERSMSQGQTAENEVVRQPEESSDARSAVLADLSGAMSPTGGYREYKASQPPQPSPQQIVSKDEDHSQVPSAQAESKVDTSPTAAGKGGLSAKETEALQDSDILAPFFKMQKMGVPVPSIKHKMTIEKIDPG